MSNVGDCLNPYLAALQHYRKHFADSVKLVRHHDICPKCGRKNVNTYRENRQSKVWLCRLCCDEVRKVAAANESTEV